MKKFAIPYLEFWVRDNLPACHRLRFRRMAGRQFTILIALAAFFWIITAGPVWAGCIPTGGYTDLPTGCMGNPCCSSDVPCLETLISSGPQGTMYRVECFSFEEPLPVGGIEEIKPVIPELQVEIPGFEGFTKEIEPEKGRFVIPWIGEYLIAFYKWAVRAISVLAVVMIIIAGVQWMLAGGNVTQISQAKDRIIGALIGLVLILGTNLIFSFINPELIFFRPIVIEKIERVELYDQEDIGAQPAPNLVPISGDNIIVSSACSAGCKIDNELAPLIQAAAQELKAQGFQLLVTSAYRTAESQYNLIRENCTYKTASVKHKAGDKCGPFDNPQLCWCSPATCRLLNGPNSCPHQSGHAIDVWGAKNGSQCIFLMDCYKNKSACRKNPCQKALIEAMLNQGFCNLSMEPWHFEKPAMSSTCT